VIVLTSIVTALAYTGSGGEAYSLFNHFVSELGETANSELALLFNIGLIVSGLCLAVFMIGLRPWVDGALGWVISITGAIAGVFGALVGVFPMDNLDAHVPVAVGFFGLSLLAILLFTIAQWLGQAPRIPAWIAWVGAAAVVAAVLFLIFLLTSGAGLGAPADRPAFLAVPFFEWLTLIMVVAWAVSVSVVLLQEG
jgi:hypothetical membrane protein